MRGVAFSEQARSSDCTATADQSNLQHASGGNNSDRDQRCLRKIDVLGRPSSVLQDCSLFQSTRLNELTNRDQVGRGQIGKYCIPDKPLPA